MIPNALVPPGQHTLTVEPETGSNGQKTTISANLEAEKRYRFAIQNGNVALVEDDIP